MCLVVFQKIFRKIFSGVWKRKRKTQIQKNTSHNPEKTQTQFKFFLLDLSPARSRKGEIAINGAILSSRDRDRRIFLSDLAIFLDGSLAGMISPRRDCDQRRDRVRRFSSRARTRSLSLSFFGNALKGK